MKQKRLFTFLCMLMALIFAVPTHADEITVCDGASTNSYLPLNGYWMDYTQRMQFIYPASKFGDIPAGSEISALTFYPSSSVAYNFNGTCSWKLMEEASLSINGAFLDVSNATTVLSGAGIVSIANQALVVTFSESFEYGGGDLLIEFQQTAKSSACTSSGYSFKGEDQSAACAYVQYGSTTANPSFLPKMKIEYTPGAPASCPKPGKLLVSDITEASAMLSWSKGGSESSWELVCGDQTFVVSDTFQLVEGLTSNMAYEASVRAICAVGDSSKLSKASFRTTCGLTTTFPWEERFESYSTGSFTSDCWRNEHTYSVSSATSIFSITSSANGGNATKQLYLPDMKEGNKTMLVLPVMQIPAANEYEFKLDVFRNATSYATEGIRVYVSPTDTISADAVELAFISRNYAVTDSVNVPAEAVSDWYTYSFNIPMSGVCYIILQGESQWGSATYLDNFVVRKQPSCKKVSNIRIDNIEVNSADILWDVNGAESDWSVFAIQGSDTLFNGSVSGEAKATLALESGTRYTLNVWVVADCGDEKSDTVRSVLKFDSGCEAWIPVNDSVIVNNEIYTSGVLPPCFVNIPCGTYVWKIGDYNAHTGSKNFEAPGLPSDTDKVGMILPLMELPEDAEISFWMREHSSHRESDSLTVWVNSEPSIEGAEWLLTAKPQSSTDEFFRAPIPADYRTGCYIILMYHGYFSSHVDDILISPAPMCLPVHHLELADVTLEHAAFTWQHGADEEAWMYSYRFFTVQGEDTIVISEDEVETDMDTIFIGEGLDEYVPVSKYQGELTVWALCDDLSEPATAEFTFTTPCVSLELPYVENFEGFDEGSSSSPAPGCWDMLGMNLGTYPYLYVTNASAYVQGSRSLLFRVGGSSGAYGYAILPEFTEPLNMLQIAFSHKEESTSLSGKTTVGYMTDITDASTFVALYECGRSTSWKDEFVGLGAVPEEVASTARLVIRHGGVTNSSFYDMGLDNVRVEVMPDCAQPTNLRAGIVTSSSAEILWNPGAKEKEWKLLVKHGTDTLYNDSIKDVPAFVVEDLEANTDYTFAVEVMACGEDTLRGSVSLTTLCNSMSREEIPYSMDFESVASDAMPDCWNKIAYEYTSYGTDYSYPCVKFSSYSSYEGNKYLYFYGNGSAAQENFAILPEMDMPLDSLNIKFMYKASSSTYSVYPKVIVGVMSNPADKSTFIGLDTLPYAADYTEYDLDIPAVPEECHFIAIEYGTGNSSNGAYIDNLVVSKQMACKKVRNVRVERAGLHDAVIAWDGQSEKYAVTLKCGDNQSSMEVEVDSVVLSELPSSSTFKYLVTVQGICDADSSEVVAAELVFITACEAIDELPWSIDFESMGAGQVPVCWDMLKQTGEASSSIYVSKETDHALDAQSLKFSAGGYAVLPEMDVDFAGKEIVFSYQTEGSYSGDLEFGYMTDVNSVATFVSLAQMEKSTVWNERIGVALDSVPAGARLAFHYIYSSSSWFVFVDNIIVREIPTCFPGSNVHLIDSTITLTSATIEWNKEEGQTEWQVVLLNGVDTFRNVTVSDTVYTIEGLSHSTNYNLNAFVYTVCGDALSPDAATATLSFATECQAIDELPWSIDFEGVKANIAPVCWDMLTQTGTASTSIYVSKETTHALDAQSLKFKEGGYAVLPEMDVDFAGKQIVFSYQHEGDQSGELEFGYITDVTDVATFVSMIQLERSKVWNERIGIALDSVPAGARLAFHYIYSSSSWFMFVDNIIVRETPMCDVPMHLQVGDVTAHTAALNWRPGAKETAWDVLITRGSDTIVETSVDTTFYMIEGLEANKQDTLEVNIIACGTDTLTKSVVFKTLCDPMPADELPLVEDFENAISYPDCWSRLYTSSTAYPYVSTSATSSHLGSKYLYFSDYYVQYAILPEQTVDLNTLMLSFYYQNYSTYSSYGQFIVGVMSDPSDESTFIPLETLERKSSYTYYETYLSGVPEGYHFVAIMLTEGDYGYGAYIDDLMLKKQPTCKRVTDIALFAAGENDATFTWTANSGESQWQVVINDGTNTITDTVESAMYVLRDLSPMTEYHCSIGITALCGDGEVSDAASANFSFMTAMPASYVQSLVKDEAFIPNFADAAEQAKWVVMGADETNHFIFGQDPAALETEAAALYVSDDDSTWHYTNNAASASIVYRRFSVAKDSAVIAVSFDWQANGETSGAYDAGRAFIVPAVASREVTSSSSVKVGGTQVSGSAFATVVPNDGLDLVGVAMYQKTAFEAVADTIVLEESGEYDILFTWANDGSYGNQYPLCIKNLELKLIAESSVITKMEEIMIGDEKAVKVVRNGHVYILRRGHVYSILGQKMK